MIRKPNPAFFLLLWFLFFLSSGYSQIQSPIVIKGRIINASTGEAIGYATIRLLKNGINTISNENGGFVFKIPADQKRDSIYISHIGYKPLAIVADMSDTTSRTVRLQEDRYQLPEMVVRSINPLTLLKKAIAKIPDNYASKPYLLNGFYRYTGRKENRIINLSEAVFDIYNESYSRKNKEFRLIRSRYDIDIAALNGRKGITIGYTPGGIIENDIVSNAAESGLLSKEGLHQHNFFYKGMVDYNGQKAYEIQFDQKENVKKPLFRGKLFLNADNLAFLEIDLALSPKGIKYWELGFSKKIELMLMGLKYTVLSNESIIAYRNYGGKYYLDYVKENALWHLLGTRDHFDINPLRISYNYVVTGIDTQDVQPFKKDKFSGTTRLIEDNSSDSTDEKFWGSYNLIQADFNVDSVVGIIRTNNSTQDLKHILTTQLPKLRKDKSLRMDSILSFYYEKGQFNGVALVQDKGHTVYEKGFGLANKENNIPFTDKTQFRIGSMSKQFTSMLIMQLANENKLNINDSVGKFLPGFSNGKVTIQQLLTHQSGIPNYSDKPEYMGKIITTSYSLDELIRNFAAIRWNSHPEQIFTTRTADT